jgi:hypothetical protein
MSETFDPNEGVDKKDPLDLPNERPDYVEDKTGNAGDERVKPDVNAGPEDVGFLGKGKRPTVHLDKEKVRKHDEEVARDPSKGA